MSLSTSRTQMNPTLGVLITAEIGFLNQGFMDELPEI